VPRPRRAIKAQRARRSHICTRTWPPPLSHLHPGWALNPCPALPRVTADRQQASTPRKGALRVRWPRVSAAGIHRVSRRMLKPPRLRGCSCGVRPAPKSCEARRTLRRQRRAMRGEANPTRQPRANYVVKRSGGRAGWAHVRGARGRAALAWAGYMCGLACSATVARAPWAQAAAEIGSAGHARGHEGRGGGLTRGVIGGGGRTRDECHITNSSE
jgi:hypothetical protein